MKVITDSGEIDLGTVEAAPTISIVDFSRRVTDDFGITTIVERGFARRLSVRLAVPFEDVDGLLQSLADLRATPAQWVADEDFAWLNFEGFYKDFEIDLNVPPLSYCTLTIEGLAETETVADPGGDPAPEGQASTLYLLQPATMDDAALVSSSVPETDHAAWASGAVYSMGDRVIRAHRIYESVTAGNVGNDPATSPTFWLDAGPTNRWAMLDQALGTATTASGSIVVTLAAASLNAVTLLDVTATSVRVQASGYDQTQAVSAGSVIFSDLPAGTTAVTVTVTGSGPVSVGTLLVGEIVALGVTEASPTAGIIDYSRKETDDFGEVTVVQRAWAKRMATRALIRTEDIDLVANRIAAVRARPSLWIGDAGTDSLTVYGLFREFAIEVGETVSKLSLSIEGLSEAAQIAPFGRDGRVFRVITTNRVFHYIGAVATPTGQEAVLTATGENLGADLSTTRWYAETDVEPLNNGSIVDPDTVYAGGQAVLIGGYEVLIGNTGTSTIISGGPPWVVDLGTGETKTITSAMFGANNWCKITAICDGLTDKSDITRVTDGEGGVAGPPGEPGRPNRLWKTYSYSDPPPADEVVTGDFWLISSTLADHSPNPDPDAGKWYEWNGSAWVQILGKVSALEIITRAFIENAAIGTAQIDEGVINILHISDFLQSLDYVAGVSGWRIEKSGAAEFNGVVMSRDLILGSGYVSAGPFTGSTAANAKLGTVEIDTGIASTAWASSKGPIVAIAGFQNTEVTTTSGSESVTTWEAIVTNIRVRNRWSDPATIVLTVEVWGRCTSIGAPGAPSSPFELTWTVYDVT